MKTIKNKISVMKMERENALDGAEQLEQKVRDTEEQKVRIEVDLNNLQKKCSNLENDFDNVNEQLQDTMSKLENSEKRMTDMEHEVSSTTRRIKLLEGDLESVEERLQTVTENLEEASKPADESERGRMVLESKNLADAERIDQLEAQLKDAKYIAEYSESIYVETVRKLAVTEGDLERVKARLEAAKAKSLELEEALTVVGNNLKSLEISEQRASQSEDSYEETIRDLTQRLNYAENRQTEAEKTVSKLQKEVDRLEDELLAEKERYKSRALVISSTRLS